MSAAARMRRCRERAKAGRLAVMVEIDEADVDVLVDARLLDAISTDDKTAIGKAIARTLRLLRVTS